MTASPEQIADPNNYEDPADYRLRQQLGLRPIYYPDTTGGDHEHPDRRPCPPWCSLGQSDFEHEVDPAHVTSALHSTDLVTTLASKYRGAFEQDGTAGATIETQMYGYGEAKHPTIVVNLRMNDSNGQHFLERLKLSINDAADLATILQYLIAQADAAQALR